MPNPLPRLSTADYHRFSTSAGEYLFVTTNWAILKLSPLFGELLDLLERGAEDDVVRRTLTWRFGQQDAERGIEEYRRLWQTGHLERDDDLVELPQELPGDLPLSHVVLMVAGDCNMRCAYCFEDKPMSRQRMSIETADAAVDFLLARSQEKRQISMTFFGGEPLLNMPVIRHVTQRAREIEAAGDKQFNLSITTNASLLDDEIVDFFADNGVGVLISMDGPKDVQDAHRRFRGGKPSFDRVYERVSRYIERRKRGATIRATLTAGCLDLTGMSRFFLDMGATGVFFSAATNVNHNELDFRFTDDKKRELLERYDEYIEHVREELRRGRIKRDHVIEFIELIFDGNRRTRPCQSGITSVSVCPDGSVYPCYRFVGIDGYRMGNLHEPLDESIRLRFFRENHVGASQECRSCWARYICGGECPGDTVVNHGGIMHVDPFYCAANRHLIEGALRIYVELGFSSLRSRSADGSGSKSALLPWQRDC